MRKVDGYYILGASYFPLFIFDHFRVDAFRRFGPSEVALIELENQLAEEKQRLSNLKREVLPF